MITQLTAYQKEQIKVYREKYIKIGLNTDRIDEKQCMNDINDLYVHILDRKKPEKIFICKSPYQAWKRICYYVHEFGENEQKSVKNLKAEDLDVNIDEEKYMINFVYPYLQGSMDVNVFGYYDYIKEVLGLDFPKKYEIFKKTMNYGYIFPLQKVCFVSEKPVEINMIDRVLHADYKPAVKFEDGFSLWRLNGITVPEWIVMTKPENMDIEKIMKIKNVEVRREAIRKLGTTLLLDKLKYTVIDKKSLYVDDNNKVYAEKKGREIKYELIEAELEIESNTNRKVRLLKMENPSIKDVSHYEFVKSECETVLDCFAFRNGTEVIPFNLS